MLPTKKDRLPTTLLWLFFSEMKMSDFGFDESDILPVPLQMAHFW